MTMPQLPFLLLQPFIQFPRYQILDANQPRPPPGRIVDETLSNIGIEMGAVMVCFHDSVGVRGVDVEGVDVCADGLDRSEILGDGGAVLEDDVFRCKTLAERAVLVMAARLGSGRLVHCDG